MTKVAQAFRLVTDTSHNNLRQLKTVQSVLYKIVI